MPLWQYKNEATGETLEMVRPYALRDMGVPPGFVRQVSAPGVVVKYRGNESMADAVRRGYYDHEQKEGSRFKSGFTKKQIAAAWDQP